MERVIRFFNEQDRRAEGKLGGANDSLDDVGLNVLFKDLKFYLKKIVNRTENRIGSID